jgi:hypothetical protein
LGVLVFEQAETPSVVNLPIGRGRSKKRPSWDFVIGISKNSRFKAIAAASRSGEG